MFDVVMAWAVAFAPHARCSLTILPIGIFERRSVLSIDDPAFDLLTTMSKFLCSERAGRCGSLPTEIHHATSTSRAWHIPARRAGRCLGAGSEDGAFDYVDVTGEHLAGKLRLSARAPSSVRLARSRMSYMDNSSRGVRAIAVGKFSARSNRMRALLQVTIQPIFARNRARPRRSSSTCKRTSITEPL